MSEELALVFNRFSTLPLDVKAAGFAEGDLIQQAGFNGGGNQRWIIVDTQLGAEPHHIAGAVDATSRQYQIVAIHSGMALTPHANNTQVVQMHKVVSPTIATMLGQIWHLAPFGGGEYVIRNKRQGTVLGLKSASKSGGIEAELRSFAAGDATQRWDLLVGFSQVAPLQTGAIMNVHSMKVADVRAISTADNAVVQQSTYNGGPNQRWEFQVAGSSPPLFTITATHSGKQLAFGAFTGSQAMTVQRAVPGMGPGQAWILSAGRVGGPTVAVAWTLEPWAGGSPSYTNLDLPGGTLEEGHQLQVYAPRHRGENQLWEVWVYR